MLVNLKFIVNTMWRNLLSGGAITKRQVKRKISTMKECVNQKNDAFISGDFKRNFIYCKCNF